MLPLPPNLATSQGRTCDHTFKTFKALLSFQPVLQSPDFEKEFVLKTDASNCSVGAVLSQNGEVGNDHPVAFFNRKLCLREANYSTIEKECLAIKLVIQEFQPYLADRQFVVGTDHWALEWLDCLQNSNSRLAGCFSTRI